MQYNTIIQGGMGAGVSDWRLARAVAHTGQLGVVSGTALDTVLARRLQVGDPGGHLRRALASFPFQDLAERILARYFVPGGKSADAPFRLSPMPTTRGGRERNALTVVANFVEVWLAKEGHDRPIGINYLEKIQVPTLPSIFGAMLAGVGCVIMGAGIPRAIPGILDRLAEGKSVELPITVQGEGPATDLSTRLDPAEFWEGSPQTLERPAFIPIVSSVTLAQVLARKATGRVDGFVVEGRTAGGHNAPPRGAFELDERGEPVYGERDDVKLKAFRKLGLPFWLAGSQAEPGMLDAALAEGATGIQVGTAFAFCEESGIDPAIKRQVIDRVRAGTVRVRTDPRASPTGFPFKVLDLPGSASVLDAERTRARSCDLGYLRTAYARDDGTVGWRCPAEPPEQYVKKGGDLEDTDGRLCVCNGLVSTIGLPQVRSDGTIEAPLVTAGDDIEVILRFLPEGSDSYSAQQVVDGLLATATRA